MKKDNKVLNIIIIAALIVLAVIPSMPFMRGYMPYGHDLEIHLRRVAGLAEGIQDGVFPVKMQQHWFNNYGYPMSIMYGDVLLYIPAVLYLGGMALWKAYAVYIVLINLGTALISYYVFKKISGNKFVALMGAYLYQLSIWRLIDIVTRQAVGEYSAIMFMPLIALGMYLLFTSDKEYGKSFLLIVGGFTGLMQTHLLSMLMAGVFTVILCITQIPKIIEYRCRRLIILIAAVISIGIVNLGTLVPMLDYYANVPMQITEEQDEYIQTYGIQLDNLTVSIADTNVLNGMQELGTDVKEEMPQTTGTALLIAFCLVVVIFFALIILEKKSGTTDKSEYRYNQIIITMALAALSLFMSSCYMPYDYLKDHLSFIYKFIGSVQYPARYLALASLFITVAFVIALGRLTELFNRMDLKAVNIGAFIITALICVVSVSQGIGFMNLYLSSQEWTVDVVDAEDLGIYNTEDLYLLIGTDMDRIQYSNVIAQDDAFEVGDFGWDGKVFTANLTAADSSNTETVYVELPIFAYKGYVCKTLDGTELVTEAGDNNKIRAYINADYTGDITVRFCQPWYWIVSQILSLIGIIIFVIYTFNELKIKSYKETF